jgi:hypothetical protein
MTEEEKRLEEQRLEESKKRIEEYRKELDRLEKEGKLDDGDKPGESDGKGSQK